MVLARMAGDVTSVRLATTFRSGLADPRLAERADRLPVPEALDDLPRGRFRPLDEARLYVTVLRAAFRCPALLLYSSRGYLKPELMAVVTLNLVPRTRRPAVVVYGEMYQRDLGVRGLVQGLVMRAAGRVVRRWVVYSEAERAVFARVWGLDVGSTRACLHSFEASRFESSWHDEPSAVELPPAPYVFAGGSSYRDWGPLLEAAGRMPETTFVIAAPDLPEDEVPSNVQLRGLDAHEYLDLLTNAAVVVVPLRVDVVRAAGTYTILRAMHLGLPTVATDAVGVREYVDDGVTGFVVDGTGDGYVRVLGRLLDPGRGDDLRLIGEAARRAVTERFSLAAYIGRLLPVIDEAIAEAQAERPS